MADIDKTRVLGGVRILELADQKGEFCGKLAADFGADVIKIEQVGGAPTRRTGPFVDDIPNPNNSLSFWYNNTSKRSVTLNLDCLEGREMFKRLALNTDVILETYPPGYLDEIGLGYERLSKESPGLIMISITPFGQTGPYRNFKESDLVNLAMGGPVFCCGYDNVDVPDAPPIRPDGGHSYITGGYHGFIGILFALYNRDLTGKGQYIDCSIHEACSLSTEHGIPYYIMHHAVVQRHTGRYASMRPTPKRQFLCRDGRWVNIFSLPRTAEDWRQWLTWMKENDIALGDFETMTFEEIKALERASGDSPDILQPYIQLLTMFTAKLTADEIFHGGQKRSLMCAVIRPPEETLTDAHLRDRGFFVEVEHPEVGKKITYPGSPFISNKMSYEVRRAPLVGEHNTDIYRKELGFSKERLVMLAEASVI